MIRRPPRSTLFPYPPLFRSAPDVGLTSSHTPLAVARALHASGPDPVFERVRLSCCIATLPAAAVSSTRPGAIASAAAGGGGLVSLSSLQVTQTTGSAHAGAPSAEGQAGGRRVMIQQAEPGILRPRGERALESRRIGLRARVGRGNRGGR